MDSMHFLVVEDDPDGQEVVGRMLRHQRISFDGTYTAEDALERLASSAYDMVIIDLQLPGMDGWTLLSTIRSHPEFDQMPCVAVTAYHSTDVAVKALDSGFTAYFPKPLDATSFVRELQSLLV